jgi:hypothetical protein
LNLNLNLNNATKPGVWVAIIVAVLLFSAGGYYGCKRRSEANTASNTATPRTIPNAAYDNLRNEQHADVEI